VASFNEAEIRKLPGVIDVFVLEGTGKPVEVMPGVAIIANSTWAAFRAKAALKVEWDESQASKDSTTQAAAMAKQIAAGPMPSPTNKGDVDAAFAAAGKIVEAAYDYGFVPHQPLEPMNSTAWWHDGVMEVWSPTQQADRGLPQYVSPPRYDFPAQAAIFARGSKTLPAAFPARPAALETMRGLGELLGATGK